MLQSGAQLDDGGRLFGYPVRKKRRMAPDFQVSSWGESIESMRADALALRTRSVSLALAVVLFATVPSARADVDEARQDATVYRLWVEPPIGGFTFAFGESPSSSTLVHLAGLAFGLELANGMSIEAGGGALVSSVGGEPGLSLAPDAWAKIGLARLVDWRAPESGWEVQLASSLGYRYMARGKITYEDYGVDMERIHALCVDIGPVLTHWSKGGLNLALRATAGALVPFARSHSRENLYNDYAPARLHFAVPVQFDIGLAF